MNEPTTGTTGAPRAIFRADALQRYLNGREKVVLPRYTTHSVSALLWALVGLLVFAAVTLGLARVPRYTRSAGVVDTAASRVVLFVPAGDLPRLAPGQPVRLWLSSSDAPLDLRISSVEPAPIAPTDARNRFQLDGAAAAVVTGPSAVVTVDMNLGAAARAYAGSIVTALVDTGAQRLLSSVSLFGRGE
jgi:hypothetical protein